ncbi:dTDP-glucose 4,6-dehydratase [Archaeoglobales archaeon]|nr:MAG: dTDP-glucose 4,6-dehydratase [Archaeoglobales archaeon]
MRLLITGGAGFIGSNFVRYMLKNHPNYEIVVLDKLTYAGRIENLQEILDIIEFIRGDICNEEDVKKAMKDIDVIINFAAESHVDRSIDTPEPFIKTDVFGTFKLLEACRKYGVEKYVQISTDEVYGSIIKGSFKETDPLDPSSPYSASKAGADLLCKAYYKTYGLPVLITRSSNNYGPFQYPEKLIPVLIIKALHNQFLPIYGDGTNVRDWLYVEDNCSAIDIVLQKGKSGEIYNVGANDEWRNIDVAKLILKELNKPESLITFVEDRPGHDYRYSLDTAKIRDLGWRPRVKFEDGIRKTVRWYVENRWWWEPIT